MAISFFPRQLIILQGSEQLIDRHLCLVTQQISGDWITITSSGLLAQATKQVFSVQQAKQLLGREFQHAIFDARIEFNLDALAILSGTLKAGSVLILLLPNDMDKWQDMDSLRWNDAVTAKSVPNFIVHLHRVIQHQLQHYPQNTFLLTIDNASNEDVIKDFIQHHQLISHYDVSFNAIQQQKALLNELNEILSAKNMIIVLTAKRGRGKSALAGQFACHHSCWVTAPNKNAINTLLRFAPEKTIFYAPDELILHLQQTNERPEWLIIDEAAMIPLPIITKLMKQNYNVLLTSTIDGYEGTGQGLLLKLFNQLKQHKQIRYCHLTTPIRWCENDPLEYFIDQMIIAQNYNYLPDSINAPYEINKLTQSQLVNSQDTLTEFFSLLKSAHYRTTLVDLRRLLDADKVQLYIAQQNQHIIGVLITIKEGGLSDELVNDILCGYRRPRGNLVAQSLVAHAGEKQAALLSSIRINRIAIAAVMQRQNKGSQLIKQLINDAQIEQYDFISVSFSFAPEICQFWLKLGFSLVHISSFQEASSASYSVMAIYPLSRAGRNLSDVLSKKLSRNWYWLRERINIYLPIEIDYNQNLNQDDKQELLLFATTAYSYSASFSVLSRLANKLHHLNYIKSKQHALLMDLVAAKFSDQFVVAKYRLSGKKELLKLLRIEVQQLLTIQELFNE